eukprot:307223-Rhodomonas_salina.2
MALGLPRRACKLRVACLCAPGCLSARQHTCSTIRTGRESKSEGPMAWAGAVPSRRHPARPLFSARARTPRVGGDRQHLRC